MVVAWAEGAHVRHRPVCEDLEQHLRRKARPALRRPTRGARRLSCARLTAHRARVASALADRRIADVWRNPSRSLAPGQNRLTIRPAFRSGNAQRGQATRTSRKRTCIPAAASISSVSRGQTQRSSSAGSPASAADIRWTPQASGWKYSLNGSVVCRVKARCAASCLRSAASHLAGRTAERRESA
eukprot:scaffold1320_cov326-Prasinococcus_capsulatus_cf.AAC.4